MTHQPLSSNVTRSTVALVRCDSYEQDAVHRAVQEGVDLLGGVAEFVHPGERILLKPNLLLGRPPERCVTTHPSVFRAVALVLQAAGVRLTYGDSPGFGRPETAAQRSGLAEVAQELGIEHADFGHGESVSFPEGVLIKQFTLARAVLEADGLVSIPKMKTHGLTRITGAIKNQFGCIPGPLKAEFHGRLPMATRFSQMLVDLNRLLRPRLCVMDGIIAMEGNGPQSGTPRPMNVLLLSTDPVALDATVCRLIDLDPDHVSTISYGETMGLGMGRHVEIVGEALSSLVQHDFDVNRSLTSTREHPGRWSRWARRWVIPKPVLLPARCTRCGTCVQVCPATPKAVAFGSSGRSAPPEYDYAHCIRCYCCQEMCPEGAIRISTPWLGRLIH